MEIQRAEASLQPETALRMVSPQKGSVKAKLGRGFVACDGPQSALTQAHDESITPRANASEWKIDRVARAMSVNLMHEVRAELRDSIRRIPYHGLWAGACTTKPQHAILMGQLGQDIVRSLNGALGQYVTAEKFGAQLRRAFQKSCVSALAQDVRLEILSQEYNMVFLRADRCPSMAQARQIQQIFSREVWSHTLDFLRASELHHASRSEALQNIQQSLNRSIPLITIGFSKVLDHDNATQVERLARSAIAACAASKLARTRADGFAFAEANDIKDALESYFALLQEHRNRFVAGHALVIESGSKRAMLNPSVLVEYRAKRLSGADAALVAQAIELLNCLDWVQQSRFTGLARLHRDAILGRNLMRGLSAKASARRLAGVKEFCLLYVPYLSIAEQMAKASGTLFWVDMKKLSVRCHIMREEKAAELLSRRGLDDELSVDTVVDAMVDIDLRVQDARDVLPQAIAVAKDYLHDNHIEHQLRFHLGGDDAAFFIHTRGSALDASTARGIGRQVAEQCSMIRVAFAEIPRGANLSEEICRLDRILSATKLD